MATSLVNKDIYCDISGNFCFVSPLSYKIISLGGKSRDRIKIVKSNFYQKGSHIERITPEQPDNKFQKKIVVAGVRAGGK